MAEDATNIHRPMQVPQNHPRHRARPPNERELHLLCSPAQNISSVSTKEGETMARKSNTRAAQGTGTIRKKVVTRSGKQYTYWEARVTVGRDPGTGKQIQKSITGQTQKEVREKMVQMVAAIDNSDYLEPSKMTLAQWLDIWVAEYMGDKKYQTATTYKGNVRNHIKPALGALKLSQLQPHTIQKFYNSLLSGGRQVPQKGNDGKIVKKDGKTVYVSAPMNAKTVRNIHGTLTKALSVAVDIGYLRFNPADRVTLPRVEKKELAPLNDEQVKAFLRAADSDDLEIIMKVILFTGLRESEALGLTWDCIDFKAGTIKVCKQLLKRKAEDGGTVLVNSTKSNKPRSVKPAPFVMDLLSRQWREQAEQRLRAGEIWQGWKTATERETSLVFTTEDGKYISQTSLRYHFKKVAAEIGAPDCRVHDLRHTFAVLSLQNGDDIKTVQSNLGHATAAFTLDVYGHVSDRMKDESANRMQCYIDALG